MGDINACTLDLTSRGMGHSRAEEACRDTLQGRSDADPNSPTAARAWLTDSKVAEMLSPEVESGYQRLTASQAGLAQGLREVLDITEFSNDGLDTSLILGLAILGKRRVWLNSSLLRSSARGELFWGSVLIHETVHAVLSGEEEPATREELAYAGYNFAKSLITMDRALTDAATLVALSAYWYRIETQSDRPTDVDAMVTFGFTRRLAQQIIGQARERAGTTPRARSGHRRIVREAAHATGISESMLCLRLYHPLDGDIPVVQERVTEMYRAILSYDLAETGLVAKSVYPSLLGYAGTGIGSPQACDLRSHPTGELLYEWAVRAAHARGLYREELGPMGVVPALRRARLDRDRLSGELRERCAGIVQRGVETCATQGLFRSDGELTDGHILLLLAGVTPRINGVTHAANLDE